MRACTAPARAALSGSASISTSTGKTPRWLHLALSIASAAMYARAYWVQLQAMTENASLMERYLKE